MVLRIAFAGTGLIARVHAWAAQKLPNVKIEAVVNHRSESMAAFAAEFKIARQYRTVKDLLKNGGIDTLIVCTPNFLHAPQSIAALEAGVHVLVEKPMAMNSAEAEAMVTAGERSGAFLMVGHVWRFDPEVIWLREKVISDHLGQIVRTQGTCMHVRNGPGGWFTQKALAGGGAMVDMGIHALDTARFLIGDPEPVSVYARIGTHYGDWEVDDTGILVVNWNQGTTSYIEAGWWQPHADEPQAATQLYGTNGFGRIFPSYLEVPAANKDATERIDSDLIPILERDRREKFVFQMSHFLDCIRENRQPNPGGEEGLMNMRVVDAAYQSARTGQVVPVRLGA